MAVAPLPETLDIEASPVKEAAKEFGVSMVTLRTWERKGKIRKVRRHPYNNYRLYDIEEIRRILFNWRCLGLTRK